MITRKWTVQTCKNIQCSNLIFKVYFLKTVHDSYIIDNLENKQKMLNFFFCYDTKIAQVLYLETGVNLGRAWVLKEIR